MKTIIFAGGNNIRWVGENSKEIVCVDSMPIIARTIWQIKGKGIEPIVVSNKVDVIEVVKANFAEISTIVDECLAASIVVQSWNTSGTNLILLGDVYYTDPAIDTILNGKTLTYGNEVEIFAMKWQGFDMIPYFIDIAKNYSKGIGRGKLWEAFRLIHNIPIENHWIGGSFELIEDETIDFDTIEDYEMWIKKYGKRK